jgi:hypothetical protein
MKTSLTSIHPNVCVLVFHGPLTRLYNFPKAQHALDVGTCRLLFYGRILELLEADLFGTPRVREDSVRRYFGVIVEALELQGCSVN